MRKKSIFRATPTQNLLTVFVSLAHILEISFISADVVHIPKFCLNAQTWTSCAKLCKTGLRIPLRALTEPSQRRYKKDESPVRIRNFKKSYCIEWDLTDHSISINQSINQCN